MIYGCGLQSYGLGWMEGLTSKQKIEKQRWVPHPKKLMPIVVDIGMKKFHDYTRFCNNRYEKLF